MTGGMVVPGDGQLSAGPTFHGVSHAPAHVPAPPFAHTRGPTFASIVIVGEAWGEQEELFGKPFMGSSGQELDRILREAGIDPKSVFFTNTFALRPPSNNIELLCGSKTEVGKDYPLTQYKQGKYIRQEYLGELARLAAELQELRPNLVVALGNTACWALLGTSGISALRGTVTECQLVPGLKVLPSYHPSAVLRQWALRPILLVDLMKALRESVFPDIRRPPRWVTIDPTLEEIDAWIENYARTAEIFGVDIETKNRQITCVGFSASRQHSLVIPFWDTRKASHSYWDTEEAELLAWDRVRYLLGFPQPKLFQNGLYDLQYLWGMGMRPKNCLHDSMLLHHSLYPELQKGLGFLGSIYTNESAWKLLNRRRSDEAEKKDE